MKLIIVYKPFLFWPIAKKMTGSRYFLASVRNRPIGLPATMIDEEFHTSHSNWRSRLQARFQTIISIKVFFERGNFNSVHDWIRQLILW